MTEDGMTDVRDDAPELSGHSSDEIAPKHRSLRQACALVFVASFVVFAISPVITNYDSYSTFPTAVSLVNHQTLSLDGYDKIPTLVHSYTVSTVKGRLITGYPWTDAIFFFPTVIAIDALHLVGGPSAFSLVAKNDMGIAQVETASLVTALACAILAWLAFERLSGSLKRRRNLAVTCGLVLALGTSAWSIASRSMWQHGPSLFLLSLGLVSLNRLIKDETSERQCRMLAVLCGLFFAAALTVRPTNVIPFAIVGVVFLTSIRNLVVKFVVGAITVIVPWIALTYIAYGSVLQPYFGSDNRSLQPAFLEALAANLVSPARGLLIFSPIVLASVGGIVVAKSRGHLDILQRVSLLIIPLTWILVSGFGSEWWGGNTYGPRFMTDTLPFIFVLSLPLVDWLRGPAEKFRTSARISGIRMACLLATAALVLVSVAFNAEGGLLRSTTCWNSQPRNVDKDPSRVWSWSDPQFLTGFRSLESGSIHASVLSTCKTKERA
jgi:hypothetical protein